MSFSIQKKFNLKVAIVRPEDRGKGYVSYSSMDTKQFDGTLEKLLMYVDSILKTNEDVAYVTISRSKRSEIV